MLGERFEDSSKLRDPLACAWTIERSDVPRMKSRTGDIRIESLVIPVSGCGQSQRESNPRGI